jgi:hypothetical protein
MLASDTAGEGCIMQMDQSTRENGVTIRGEALERTEQVK